MASPLEDLDELVLKCRNRTARDYIREAISCYRVGSFRAAIVGTWVAVCFDIISKLRELALAGDKEAEKQIFTLEEARRTADFSRSLKFERELLDLAKDQFELISPIEYTDLARLQEDRNRCAHPSLTTDETSYQPPAELARLHIHSAVTHLLQHEPAQGKVAFDRVMNEINSEYFPGTLSGALNVFTSGPLKRPRDSLLKNVFLVLLKTLVKDVNPKIDKRKVFSAVLALRKLHYKQCNEILCTNISPIFRTTEDASLFLQLGFLNQIDEVWGFLESDVRERLQNYVENLPVTNLDNLSFTLEFDPLRTFARRRLKKTTLNEVKLTLFFDVCEELGDWMLASYLKSDSFAEANNWAVEISNVAYDLKEKQLIFLLDNIAKNNQITGSNQLSKLLTKLRSSNICDSKRFDEMLEERDLSIYTMI
jgi:hypothetical protein